MRQEDGLEPLASISIIVPNFNGEKFLEKCLKSVLSSNYSDLEVLFVDDASTDASIKIVESFRQPHLRIIRNSQRIGAAACRNRAIKEARGEYIVFLDNDTEVKPDWLAEIVEVFQSDSSIGGVQCKLMDFSDRERIQAAGLYLIPHTLWGIARGQGEKNGEKWNKIEDVAAISAALVVKQEVLDKVGGFDEKLAIYTEDLDFSLRVWLAGYRIVLAPHSIVYHWAKPVEMRKSMGASKREIYFHLCKNSLRSIIKNYQIGNMLKYLFYSAIVNVGRGFFVLFRKGDLSALIGTTKGIFWNIINIRDTLKRRRKVQVARKVSDEFVMQKIMVKESLFDIYRKYFSGEKQ
jgi:GT2 family glycosyltransferase